MDQQTPTPEGMPQGPKSNSAWGIIVIIVIAGLLVGAYYLWLAPEGNENANTVTNTNTVANTNAVTNTSEASDIDTFFQDAVNQNSWALTEDYFADPVTFVIEATECCGEITPAEATVQMEYMDGVTFNFSQSQQIVQQIKTNLGNLGFADETIGIADTKQVISYHVDDNNLVDRVYMSASHELMDLE